MIFINHKEDPDNKVIIIEVKGALNSETSYDFEEYINQLLAKHKKFIIIDAEHLESVSSAGIGVILYIQKQLLSAGGFFIICSISEEISTLYGILGFDKVIKIALDKDEALKTMKLQLNLIEDRTSERPVSNESSGTREKTGMDGDEQPQQISEEIIDEEFAYEKIFDNPIILECSQCKGMIRIKRSGNYICPDCKTKFSVEPDQTVVF